jgi:signal transduction histidine kinase
MQSSVRVSLTRPELFPFFPLAENVFRIILSAEYDAAFGRREALLSNAILVVDDDADIGLLLCDRLQAMGHEVRAAADGEAALEAIGKEVPSLVFLDIEMPKLSGLEVLRRIRKDWPELPVIVMTAHGTIARAVEAMKAGASDFITKPFEMQQLKSAIAKALERKALSGEVVRLLGDISHDIKNLLTPVVSGAELLESEIAEMVERLPEMEAVKAQASHKLCDEVIAMLRDTAGRLQERTKEIADYMKGVSSVPRFGPCRIATVVDSVFKTLHLVAEEKGIVLSSEGLELLPVIQADERRLYNAFYNLINNAIPEVPSGGSIAVQGKHEPERRSLYVSVRDTGRGMSSAVCKSLFTADAISQKFGGTGLGTKLVKDVIDAHGGHITVDSQEGIGTVFHIRLPSEPSPPARG